MPAGFFCDTESVYWCSGYFFDFSTCEEEYMSGFSLLDQRSGVSEWSFWVPYTCSTCAEVFGLLWSGFSAAQLVVEKLKSCGGVRVGYLGT